MSNKPWVKFHWLRSGHFKPSSNPLCFTSTIRPIHYFQELLPLDKAWARFLDEHFCQNFHRRCLVFVFDLFFIWTKHGHASQMGTRSFFSGFVPQMAVSLLLPSSKPGDELGGLDFSFHTESVLLDFNVQQLVPGLIISSQFHSMVMVGLWSGQPISQ